MDKWFGAASLTIPLRIPIAIKLIQLSKTSRPQENRGVTRAKVTPDHPLQKRRPKSDPPPPPPPVPWTPATIEVEHFSSPKCFLNGGVS